MRFNPKARLDSGQVQNRRGSGGGGGGGFGFPAGGGGSGMKVGGGIGGVIVVIIIIVLTQFVGGGGGTSSLPGGTGGPASDSGPVSTGGQELAQGRPPLVRERVLHVRVGPLLDEVAGEDHPGVRHPDDEVVVRVAPAAVKELHVAPAQVDPGVLLDEVERQDDLGGLDVPGDLLPVGAAHVRDDLLARGFLVRRK